MNSTEESPRCPHCGHLDRQVKAGLNAGKQRYKCLACKRRYTPEPLHRGYPEETKQRARELYAAGMSLRQVGKTVNVNHATVLGWTRTVDVPTAPVTETDNLPKPSTKRRPSIADVALKAGVSTSTVSNYINDKGRMSRETGSRIDEAMRGLHFAPNALMRAIQQGRTRILGVLTFGLMWTVERGADAIAAPILQGIADVADETGHELLLYTGWPHRRERYSERNFLSGHVDGLIWVAPEMSEPILERVCAAGVPTVALLSRHVPEGAGYVNADNIDGIKNVMRHLIDLGHTRIAYVGPAHSSNYRDRRDAYRQALKAASLIHDPHLEASPRDNYWIIETYERMVDRWLELPRPPTAIVTADDGFAEIVIKELIGRGVRVPEDVSVTGFNDVPSARDLHGGLTTIRQPFGKIGEVGAERLLALIDGARLSDCRITLPVDVIPRHTSGPAREV